MHSSKFDSKYLSIVYILFNFCSSIAVTLINKACFSKIDFGYPAVLCNIHFLITWLGVEFMRQCGFFSQKDSITIPPSLRQKDDNNNDKEEEMGLLEQTLKKDAENEIESSFSPSSYEKQETIKRREKWSYAKSRFNLILPTSLSFLAEKNFLSIVIVVGLVTPLNNTSLKLNGMGFYQIFKLLVTPCVVLLEYILDRKVLSRYRAFTLTMVCIFVYISSRAETHEFSFFGLFCASIWIPLAALYKVQWGRVRKLYSPNNNTLALMHVVLPYAIIVQLMTIPFIDPPGIWNFKWTKESFLWIIASGIAAFLVNYSGFLVIGNIGALTHVLLGQAKMAITMVGAYFFFDDVQYSTTQLLGAAGAVCSIVSYSYVTIREKK